jgi:uncharacterized protein YndB with AHSA1/START domain
MTEAKMAVAKRELRLAKEIEINAPVVEVWKALTEAEELKNWFPLEARVTPGVGGKIFLSWGPDCEGEAEIVAWEPNKRFAAKEQLALIEWSLESSGGKTILRLVQSGSSTGADWENEWLESTNYGWGFMLLSLRWALEVHAGESRIVAWPRQKTDLSRIETFQRLLAPKALFAEGASNLHAGNSFSLTTTQGEAWTGKVEFFRKDRGFCLSIKELDDALFWLTIEGAPGKIEAQIWLSAFSLPESQIKQFESIWQNRLQGIFAK